MTFGRRGIGITSLLIIVLVLFGLALVIVFWKTGVLETLFPFLKNLPEFKNGNDTIKEKIIFRYQINEENKYQLNKHKDNKVRDSEIIQYYDGVAWNNFQGNEYELSNKKFEYKTLLEDFRNYYFNTPRPKTDGVSLSWDDEGLKKKYLGEPLVTRFRFIIIDNKIFPIGGAEVVSEGSLGSPPGSTLIHIDHGNNKYYPFYFVYTLDNRLLGSRLETSWILWAKEDEMDTSKSPYKEIAEYAKEWRNNITRIPISINYLDITNNKAKSENYQVKIIDNEVVVEI
jgi:hypothetical protein